MSSFLKEVTNELFTRYGNQLSNCLLVFPNRRAGLFFSKYLNELVSEPIFVPQVLTINDLIKEWSPLKVVDNLDLLCRLYKIYCSVTQSKETFDEFYHWGEMILGDFDDLDKYRVDAKHLFQNLADEKEIENIFDYLDEEQIEAIRSFWSTFNPEKLSEHQHQFVSVWESLFTIYSNLKEELESEGLAYEGMASRLVVDRLENKEIDIKYEKVIFAGFNALNRCEKDIFSCLKEREQAEFYWDYDESYVKNPYHEAGLFMRDNLRNYPSPKSQISFKNIVAERTAIEFISLSSEVGQAKFAHKYLKEYAENKDIPLEETAVVLADEELLLPVLNSIPKNVEHVNVTMGYPAKNTPVASLLGLIIDLQKGGRKQGAGFVFHHKQVLSLLNHQYLNAINPDLADSLAQQIIKSNWVHVNREMLVGDPVIEKLFIPLKSVEQVSSYLLDLLQAIYKNLDLNKEDEGRLDKIEREYIYHLFLAIKRLTGLLDQHKIEIKLDTFYRLLDKMIQSLSIPFEGEPLAGLQVMGILETRLLDFKRIIVLSMNEGKLPKTGTSNSFVPYHLRQGFGMPTIDHQDAIFAYYFYRLIQRPEEIKLFYSTQSDGIRTGEMSRFLYQLKYESVFKIEETNPSQDIVITNAKPISIVKNERILKQLNEYCVSDKRSFSPSALNSYMGCSLRFYYRYLAGMKEPDTILEEIDPPMFGNLFHQAMEKLYEPYVGKTISKADIEGLRKNKKVQTKILEDAFKELYFNLDKEKSVEVTGRNRLIFDIILKFIDRLLKVDSEFAPFKMIAVEGRYNIQIPLKSDGRKVNIAGIIDRVDQVENTVRVIDYKTGAAELIFKDVESLFDSENKKRNKAAFQTLLYCLFYDMKHGDGLAISPNVYGLKSIFNPKFACVLEQKEGRAKGVPVGSYLAYKQEFMDGFSDLLEEIFNPEIPFMQVEDVDVCRTCPYIEVCHR
ncbi:PD-(D/E)XK nuclease family protein [Ancylomarina sp. YFZ004]